MRARGISLAGPLRTRGERKHKSVNVHTDMHDTRGVTVHVSRRDLLLQAPAWPRPGPRALSRHGVGATRERVQYALPTRLYAMLMQFSESSAYEYVKDVLWLRLKRFVNEIREVTFRVARGSGMSLVWLVDSYGG